MKTIPCKKITNIKNIEFKTRMMKGSVEKNYKNDLFIPTLCLICCFIDGLGKGSKKDYTNNLLKYFPDLCKELGAITFYNKYRNGIIHEFTMKKGFALDRDVNMKGDYISEIKVKETGKRLITLNIDRLTKDFLKWNKSVRKRKTKAK